MSSRLHERPEIRFLTFVENDHFLNTGNAKSRSRLGESIIFAILRLRKNIQFFLLHF